ncbi:spermidine/putrescine transport system ATP-binding protein [Haladaptatus litoreus]|uniref:Molybdate/tungstate import ATP-binding protein WtpC n=1 Tax=Haladaptatus litoreus TaxID=553468 RepID=A0A1N7CS47_9EURY|nr:ABC transporter ATP-binding protein [Haladaptatus litoreus]SIR66403.1 spermidine/putrescine transport system ATP-binding protein [Haladaptatus litoreus]
MSLLTVENLTKEFGDVTAVQDVSFDVSDGEFVSILGPSGSGKSTILRMIAGFETPTDGSIRLSATELVGVPPFERDINMVFQNLALFPHLTVAENIGYGLKQAGVKKSERVERIQKMLQMVHLDGYGSRSPDELSGGEQQRVALARALVNEPELVLFDEPLSSLDRKLRQHMQTELQRIQSETGTTFLYVTHDQEVALSVSDRLIVLNEGEIEQIGSAEDLYETPESAFVADFIGDVNQVPAVVTETTETELTVEVESEPISFARNGASFVSSGENVRICVRPHKVTVSDGDTEGHLLETKGTVRERSYQGSDIVYVIETPWGRLTANVRGQTFAVDDDVIVGWNADDMHVFPAEQPSPQEVA